MSSEVTIVNMALHDLGEKPITSLTQERKAARIANETYPDHRDYLLAEHPWNFATRRLSLPEDPTSPVWGYDHAYPLPADVLRVSGIDGGESWQWNVESTEKGRHIATDLGPPLNVKAIYRITDPNRMPPYFRKLLSKYLASQWAEPITGTDSIAPRLWDEFTRLLTAARSMDGQEGTTPVAHIRGSWLDARHTGHATDDDWWWWHR